MIDGLSSKQVLLLFSQVLDGVEAAYRSRVVHRDLKPENVLYETEANRVLMADFGIADFEEDELLTAVASKHADRLASIAYAVPEQRVRNQQADHRADIYALGLMLNEMFTGHVLQGAG
jgi:serine/threonine protein kinase